MFLEISSMPRKYIKKRNPPQYSKEDLANAVNDVKEKRKSFRDASKFYRIPVSVIYNRIGGRKIPVEKMGAGISKTLSIKEENHIVTCLKMRASSGYPCNKTELLQLIGEYAKLKNFKTRFKEGIPGEDWYRGFMSRHPSLSLKKPEHLQKLRKDARKPEIIYDFYTKLKRIVEENGLDKPNMSSYIFNADETGFNSDPSRIRAIGPKGKALYRVSGGSGRESTTVLACVSADGNYLPPLIVFKGGAVQARWVSDKALPGTLYAASTNGWMEEPQFYQWLTSGFIPHVQKIRNEQNKPNQKALLTFDGHCSHVSVRIIEEAINNNIELLRFPSHLTDRLQPLDRCVFKAVKYVWDRKLVAFGKEQMGKSVGHLTKNKFVEYLGETWKEAMLPKNIISGFQSTGVYPVNPAKFPEQEFDPKELQFYKEKILPDLCNQRAEHSSDNTENNTNTNNSENTSLDTNLNLLVGVSSKNQVTSAAIPELIPCSTTNLDSATNLEDVTSPTKQDLMGIFRTSTDLPAKINLDTATLFKPASTEVVPRLKQLAYGEVLTTDEVLNRIKTIQEQRKTTGKRNKKGKQKGNKETEANSSTKKKRRKETKSLKNKKDSSSDESEAEVSYAETDDSPWEEQEEYQDLQPVEPNNLKEGKFAIVGFKGGKRMTASYRYLCVIEEIDLDEDEVKIIALKCTNNDPTVFSILENDVSYERIDQIIGITPDPIIVMKGERVYYKFPKPLDIFEKP